jgi:hypothetical protein
MYSFLVNHFSIPDELITGVDETNIQFVPTIKRARVPRGTRRIRIIGIGHEKPQITLTIGANATGELLHPTQLIFGGKTCACHPNKGKVPPPPNLYYEHTLSHWQTPSTYMRYLEKVIVPNRLKWIERLGLPFDQKALHRHDLHYSHKDPEVLDFMEKNHLIPLFINAGHTDIRQECDCVMNKPLKHNFTSAFKLYLHGMHNKYLLQHANNTSNEMPPFIMDLRESIMKPLMPKFAVYAYSFLETEAFQRSIRASF